ncbi:glycosyltransferase family 61 protein [Methylobacterium isbiliense]|uniref:Glycosyltransferase 61 catalytic domain-containing protein n=1 Tax=Methylobacterium isbiliense TaxID=315478 RepID=A0ABQ4SIU1_9HYPH|nr:glycosyltransferase family 61 protein [Methylobacterium isbiliense]MDN3627287.1 glycosyltransferase family 61 protein [Methylobacterium isbiliense]GJE02353.1 hypothetical protein GMJLKIPL_4300 [Methylobacterium isbiliense]
MSRTTGSLTSCDIDILYKDGGFPEAATVRDEISPRDAAIEFVGTLYEGRSYERPLPASLHAPDEAYAEARLASLNWIKQTWTGGLTSALFCIRNAIVLDNAIYFQNGDEIRGIYETFRPQDLSHLPLNDPDVTFVEAARSPDTIDLIFNNGGSFNYGHWIVEDLPRLKAFWILRRLFPDKKINIVFRNYHPIIDQIRLQSIDLLLRGSDYTITRINREDAHHFERLYYASPVAVPPALKSPEALRFVASRLRRQVLGVRVKAFCRRLYANRSVPLRRKLFVDRSASYGRSLSNRHEVLAVLARYGFEIVDPLSMSFQRQVATFADARLVVGIMGAAMTNTMFCKPGSTVVHLAAQGWDDPFFWDLASACSHTCHILYGSNESIEQPNRDPFAIDVERLEKILAELA